MYWGVMGVVEKERVWGAMIVFGNALKPGTAKKRDAFEIVFGHHPRMPRRNGKRLVIDIGL
jgi:hypothetical protein